MKFRDPKTGEVFEEMRDAWTDWCCRRDCSRNCVISKLADSYDSRDCYKTCERNPTEAARLMGFEVVEEPIEKNDKPRFTEEEVAVLRHLCAIGITNIKRCGPISIFWRGADIADIMTVPVGFLPSLLPNQSISLADLCTP